ncbi:MAG: Crp/Fnr family transcriptional regulator [Flavobacteriales bacterium]|jgi:CRP/FNR family transcriptional regulator|tara:strand:+ start:1328 stop:2014 length:687 start_codon:yes stop_codon:yes gene_type:complete
MQEFKTNTPRTHFCMFSELSREQIASLRLQEIDNSYKKGEVLFSEGSYPKALYVVYKGIVKIHKYGINGKEQITRLASAGDLIGYRSLLNNESYTASATAIEETKLFKIPSEAFFNLLKENPDFSMKVIQMLANDLRQSEKQVVNMAQKSVREKIAEALLLLSNKFGVNENTNALNSILTRKEIGDIAGVTTESAIRTISDFNKEEIIGIEGKRILIKDLTKLEREAI